MSVGRDLLNKLAEVRQGGRQREKTSNTRETCNQKSFMPYGSANGGTEDGTKKYLQVPFTTTYARSFLWSLVVIPISKVQKMGRKRGRLRRRIESSWEFCCLPFGNK